MSHKLRSNLGHLLLHIVLLSIGVIFLLPFVWSVSTSLKPMADLFQVTPNLIPSQIRWDGDCVRTQQLRQSVMTTPESTRFEAPRGFKSQIRWD